MISIRLFPAKFSFDGKLKRFLHIFSLTSINELHIICFSTHWQAFANTLFPLLCTHSLGIYEKSHWIRFRCQFTVNKLLNCTQVHATAPNDDGKNVTKHDSTHGGLLYTRVLHSLQSRCWGKGIYADSQSNLPPNQKTWRTQRNHKKFQ